MYTVTPECRTPKRWCVVELSSLIHYCIASHLDTEFDGTSEKKPSSNGFNNIENEQASAGARCFRK